MRAVRYGALLARATGPVLRSEAGVDDVRRLAVLIAGVLRAPAGPVMAAVLDEVQAPLAFAPGG